MSDYDPFYLRINDPPARVWKRDKIFFKGDAGPAGAVGPEGPQGPAGPLSPELDADLDCKLFKVYFRDTFIGLYSQADGFLDIFADEGIRIGDSKDGAPLSYSLFGPRGHLLLPPGDIAAGKAPLQMQAGSLLTAPVAGSLEMDQTGGLYLTPTNHRRFISLAADSIIATTEATTELNTVLWTGILNANELKAQRVYVIEGCGIYTTSNASVQATIEVKFGGATALTILTPPANVVDIPWHLKILITIRTIGVGGAGSSFGIIETGRLKQSYVCEESFPVDTTLISDVTISVAWGGVGNSLKLTQAWMSTQD